MSAIQSILRVEDFPIYTGWKINALNYMSDYQVDPARKREIIDKALQSIREGWWVRSEIDFIEHARITLEMVYELGFHDNKRNINHKPVSMYFYGEWKQDFESVEQAALFAKITRRMMKYRLDQGIIKNGYKFEYKKPGDQHPPAC